MSSHNTLFELFEEHCPYVMMDPGDAGTLEPDRQLAIFKITTAAAETRTLAQPTKPGLICAVAMDVDGGDLTLTVTGGYNQAADTSITFGDAGDWVVFYSVEVGTSQYWRVLGSEGVEIGRVAAGAGAAAGTGVVATEYGGSGLIHKTVLTLTDHSIDMTDEAGVVAHGGEKIYDFPEGAILILGAVVDLTVTADCVDGVNTEVNHNWNGDCALGTAVASNNNTLTGTEANILASFATNQAVAAVAQVKGQGSSVIATTLNGVATAADMYLNYLIDDSDQNIDGGNGAALRSNGTITVHWLNLGDIS